MARRRSVRRSEAAALEQGRSPVPRRCKDYQPYFPVKSVFDVVKLLQFDLGSGCEPNLVFWSSLLGLLESLVTLSSQSGAHQASDGSLSSGAADINALSLALNLPAVDYSDVKAIYDKFEVVVRNELQQNVKTSAPADGADAEYPAADYAVVTGIRDCIWKGLGGLGSYEKAHLQFLTSYVLSYQLDAFGCAMAVVAAGQLLHYPDMHLALSEGHVWLSYGTDLGSRIEVSWHGKNPDTRKSITDADMKERWLYSGGKPLVCDRVMELSLLFSVINPSQNAVSDSLNLTLLQYCLLETLYTAGKLTGCPQAHVALAEASERLLEAPKLSSPALLFVGCERLYTEAIRCAQELCSDAFIYPYLALAAFYYRQGQNHAAMRCWAAAAKVLGRYTYTAGDDDEPYKDFQEIVSERIPHILATDPTASRSPVIFSYIVRIMDGLCKWEEGSNCAVLHAGWAKNVAVIASKFDSEVRNQVKMESSVDDESPVGAVKPQSEPDDREEKVRGSAVVMQLSSTKMAGFRKLLVAEKVSMEAVQLQMAAQVGSAARGVHGKRRSGALVAEDPRHAPPPKRTSTGASPGVSVSEKNASMDAAAANSHMRSPHPDPAAGVVSSKSVPVNIPRAPRSETRGKIHKIVKSFASARGVCIRSPKAPRTKGHSAIVVTKSVSAGVGAKQRGRPPKQQKYEVAESGSLPVNGEALSTLAPVKDESQSLTEQSVVADNSFSPVSTGGVSSAECVAVRGCQHQTAAAHEQSTPGGYSGRTSAAVRHRRRPLKYREPVADGCPTPVHSLPQSPEQSRSHGSTSKGQKALSDGLSASAAVRSLSSVKREAARGQRPKRRATATGDSCEPVDTHDSLAPENDSESRVHTPKDRMPVAVDRAQSPSCPVAETKGPSAAQQSKNRGGRLKKHQSSVMDIVPPTVEEDQSSCAPSRRYYRSRRQAAVVKDGCTSSSSQLSSVAGCPRDLMTEVNASPVTAEKMAASETSFSLLTAGGAQPCISADSPLSVMPPEVGIANLPVTSLHNPTMKTSATVIVPESDVCGDPKSENLGASKTQRAAGQTQPQDGAATSDCVNLLPAAAEKHPREPTVTTAGDLNQGNILSTPAPSVPVDNDVADNNPVLLSTRRRSMALANAGRRGLHPSARCLASAIQRTAIPTTAASGAAGIDHLLMSPRGSPAAYDENKLVMQPAVQLLRHDSEQLLTLALGTIPGVRSEDAGINSNEAVRKSVRRRSTSAISLGRMEEAQTDKRSSIPRSQRSTHRTVSAVDDGHLNSGMRSASISSESDSLSPPATTKK